MDAFVKQEATLYEVPVARVRGGHHVARAAGREIVIVDTPEGLRAWDAVCPHLGGPLGEGRITTRAIRCPWHHYVFDAATGRCRTVPGGPWRAGGCRRDDGRPMDIALRALRVEVRDGILRVLADADTP
jgi:nitrite reductase/ring-hydroxylating ferredoxin subunit